MLNRLDSLLADPFVTVCNGLQSDNRYNENAATDCIEGEKNTCNGCNGCNGGFAPARDDVNHDAMAIARTWKRIHAAGFVLAVADNRITVAPVERMTDVQRAFVDRHESALVLLLQDAEALHRALVDAGPAGLDWREGTPADWDDARLLAADEVLYADGRMVNRQGRRYLLAYAPPPMSQDLEPQMSQDLEPAR